MTSWREQKNASKNHMLGILKICKHMSVPGRRAKGNSICDELRRRGLGLGTALLEDLSSVPSIHALAHNSW